MSSYSFLSGYIRVFSPLVPALVPVIIGVGARHMEYGVENDSGELE